MNDLKLRPYYIANISGGKDSLYMLGLILDNQDKYPLDGVVHFEMERDYPIARNVVDYIEKQLNARNIPLTRIKTTHTWEEYVNKYGYPSRVVKWCNSKLKLDCDRKLKKILKEIGRYPISYIGLCADETRRFKYEIGNWKDYKVCYPLAEEGILEDDILQWARNQPIFEGYYDVFKRMGCMCCPCSNILDMIYVKNHYPDMWIKIMDEIYYTHLLLLSKGHEYKIYGKTYPELIAFFNGLEGQVSYHVD